MVRIRTGVLQLVAVVLAVVAMCLPARAHPHVWITVETTLVYENGAFVGVAHKWTFDELYTAMAIEGLDKNKDGKFDRTELEELTKVNLQGLKEFGYFTHPSLAGEPLKLGEARDYWQEHKGGVLSLYFTVPFATPVLAEAKGLTFAVYDPSYFIAFDLAKDNGARLGQGAPNDCVLKVGMSQSDNALGQSFGAVGAMMVIAKTIALECGPEALAAAAPGPPRGAGRLGGSDPAQRSIGCAASRRRRTRL